MKKSEQRQQDILAFMKKTIASKGYSPTVREICQALNIKSTSTVHSDIKALEDKGLVRKDPAKPRTVLPADMKLGSPASHTDDINIVSLPVIGRVAAGEPILAEQNIVDEMPIPDIEAKVEEYIKKFKNNSPRNEFRKGLHTDENSRGTSDEDGYEEAGNRHRNYEQLEDFPLYGE